MKNGKQSLSRFRFIATEIGRRPFATLRDIGMTESGRPLEELSNLFIQGLGGNESAYTLFLQKIAPLLRRFIGRRVGSADTEDIVQETLISVHKARHTYDGGRPLGPWLYAIAGFRINDYLRRYYAARRDKMSDIDNFNENLACVTNEGSENELIEEVLAETNERERKILTLIHTEGRTTKETGALLQMTESAVKTATHRAIKKIKKRLNL